MILNDSIIILADLLGAIMFIGSALSCLLGLHAAVLHPLLPQLLLAQSGSSLSIVFRLGPFRALVSFSIRFYWLRHCPPHFSLLSLLPLSQLGHTVQLALRALSLLHSRAHFSPLHHSLIGSSISLLPFLSLPSSVLLSPFSTTSP